MLERMTTRLEQVVFSHRRIVVALFILLTLTMAWSASQLRVDAGFTKLLPLEHPYMKTFVKHREAFGGANRIIVALRMRNGDDIFNPEFFKTLKAITDEVFFIPGVERTQVTSLFTPNVRFTEIVEGGFAGGNIVPADFQPVPEDLEQVRQNVLKSGYVGRLVANDFSAAIVSAALMEIDPQTGERLDYRQVAEQLETIRQQYQTDDIAIHIIGFAKVIGDVAEGAAGVIGFFGIAFLITALLVYVYSRNWKLTAFPLLCSLVAVVWQLGLLNALGFGIDPMSILVPFLVFAIGVSHGVQIINAVARHVAHGETSLEAARAAFRRLLIPGGVALISDTFGFLTLLFIEIDIIRELAITASLGVAVIIFTNLLLLPVLLSLVRIPPRLARTDQAWLWQLLDRFTERRTAAITVGLALVLAALGLYQARELKVGDLHAGVPELRVDSRYNRDTRVITEHFSIGVDVLGVIVETHPNACIDYQVMRTIDDFQWVMENVPGVQSTVSLASLAKTVNAGYNEGSLKWRVLPRNEQVLVQSIKPFDTGTGLLNRDCSVMPVLIFTEDHKAETIARIVAAVKDFAAEHGTDQARFLLATGNVGVMAATNEAVTAAQLPMLAYVYGAVIALCLLTFRSLAATLCIVLPLALVSILANALMAVLNIGLKVNTLPVVALGVGIGVDYGIYIFSRLQRELSEGLELRAAYLATLKATGNAVLFTGLTLAIGVSTWLFSALKFQADMGLLLAFMFLLNMLGAIILLPALATWLIRHR